LYFSKRCRLFQSPIKQDVRFTLQNISLVDPLHKGVAHVEPVAGTLVFITHVCDIMAATHTSRVAYRSIETVLVSRGPWITIQGFLVLRDKFGIIFVNFMDHKFVERQYQREAYLLRVLAEREPANGGLKTF
jgi:hypothetical protein